MISLEEKGNKNTVCACGTGEFYAQCCQPYHLFQAFPATAEKLMRSRYTAFNLGLADYLKETCDDYTRPGNIEFTLGLKWQKLTINGRKKGRKKDSEGWVTFIAYFEHNDEKGYLHEKSYFVKDERDHWVYVNGEIK